MKSDYLNISYNDAKAFLETLSEKRLTKIYEKYGILETYVAENNEEYSKKDQLVDIISDSDLYSLGYSQDAVPCGDDCYNYTISDIIDFLSSFNEDELFDLISKYSAYDIEDLATAITDSDLAALGFDFGVDNNIPEENSHDSVYVNTDYDYDENLDYLEDIEGIPYTILDTNENGVSTIALADVYDFNRFKESLDPNLVEYCEPLDLDISECYLCEVTPRVYPEKITEDVIINSELNPAIFDAEHKMLPEVHEQIMNYVNDFVEKMNNKAINMDYQDVQLIGSNAGYLYTPDSDIDIHFIWSTPMNKENFDQMKDEFMIYTAENPLTIGKNTVELNLEDDANIVASANRRYSLIDDDWVDDSDKNEVYTQEDMTAVEGYEDLVADYTARIDDVVDNDLFEDALDLKHEIRQNRSEDLANIGALSLGNVVFKELRNNGAYGKLREYLKTKEELLKDVE